MQTLKTLVALVVALVIGMQPAEAGILKKVGHLAKKAIMLPVYFGGGMIAGAATGTVVWYYIGGYEGDLKRALRGGK